MVTQITRLKNANTSKTLKNILTAQRYHIQKLTQIVPIETQHI
jgi:hypothetical protein